MQSLESPKDTYAAGTRLFRGLGELTLIGGQRSSCFCLQVGDIHFRRNFRLPLAHNLKLITGA
jgi:hypothetical protein